MFFMLLGAPGVNEDIVNENNDEVIKVIMEYLVHQSHESCRCVSEPERHHYKFILPVPCSECGLLYI